MATDCIFCQIVAGQAPARMVHQDDLVTAFWDIRPVAPVHILVVPNRHYDSLREMGDADGPVLGRIVQVANQIARQEGIDRSGYRFIVNVGPDAGQIVYHVHFHLLGGRSLGPMVLRR